MSLELALRWTEILLGFAFVQQSLEHLKSHQNDRILFGLRLIFSVILMVGLQSQWVLLALVVISMLMLQRFQGPYNGGSDRMGLLILFCLTLAHFMPTLQLKELAFGYLGIQLVLSYFMAGWVKVVNPEWRRGQALQDVFAFSAYPVSLSLRGWAQRPQNLFYMSWAVMLFELVFPLTLLTQYSLYMGLGIAAAFHFSNACLFGLNRFFWVWIAAYPSIIWFQERFF
ncbi:HTTM domain-containing protein [Hirschia baltica]|uniref:HTTM domain protein n=1 Tax=Hirschia baltica (strain ATCC 49814 / DSM 5838 / IFAM 1418) TaxID=582402 RepID=C6XNS8_HIRBI|nr:HTTM domain-containing protein [Hirschia baltica]ACT58331.1 HTTM domain protein [Hirschia baltica ATCC 49814]